MMIWVACHTAQAQAQPETPAGDAQLQDTLSTLNSLLKLQSQMKADMEALGKQLSRRPDRDGEKRYPGATG